MQKILNIGIFLFMSGFLFAQSDEILDKLYEQENADALYSTLIVLQAASELDNTATTEDAKAYLEEVKWGQAVLDDGEYITVGSFSLMVMEVFGLKHGIMYGILPIKRYALKEMVYQKYILGTPYSNDVISSFDVIYILSSIPVDEDLNKNYSE